MGEPRTLFVGTHVSVLGSELTLQEPCSEFRAQLNHIQRPHVIIRTGKKRGTGLTYPSLLVQRFNNEYEGAGTDLADRLKVKGTVRKELKLQELQARKYDEPARQPSSKLAC